MQGKHNQFAFTNAIGGSSEPAAFQVQNNVRRLPNGDLTVFDNGYSQQLDPAYGFTRPYSRAVEYAIDEVHQTARLVWEFRHNPDIISYDGGSVQRLAGGHTVMQWGNPNTAAPALAMTEADAAGKLVCDVALPQNGVTGNFTRQVWPIESNDVNVTEYELAALDSYVFNQGTNVTGVRLDVETIDADVYNSVVVSRQPFAPVMPLFFTTAPRVVPIRVTMEPNLVYSITGQLSFDANSFGFKDPTNTTVYWRQTPGTGLFAPLPTQYNWLTHQLQAAITDFGEFIFGFPDVAQTPYPPLLITPAQNAVVNQAASVGFFWTPQGFVGDYNLQVATDANFTSLVADEPGLTDCLYTLPSLAANTRYFWRVNTENDGGASDWVTNSFTTAPPMVQVTVPAGGEAWQRGLSHIVQWNSNLGGNVALDLYKAGSLVSTLTTSAANVPAYAWPVSLSLIPASDYTLRIRSTTNATIFTVSSTFSLVDAPSINRASLVLTPGRQVQFGINAPGAATATVLVSTNLHNWQTLQSVTITSGGGLFTDPSPATAPARFYRVSVP